MNYVPKAGDAPNHNDDDETLIPGSGNQGFIPMQRMNVPLDGASREENGKKYHFLGTILLLRKPFWGDFKPPPPP